MSMKIQRDAHKERDSASEFIDKMGKLVNEYRYEVGSGLLIGALEVVKLRLFQEAHKYVEKQMKEEGKDSFTE